MATDAVVLVGRVDGGLLGTTDERPDPVGLEVGSVGGIVVVMEMPVSWGGGVSEDSGVAGGGAETTESDGTGVFAEEAGGLSAGGGDSTGVVPVKAGGTEATGDDSSGVMPGAGGVVVHTVTVTIVVTVLAISSKIFEHESRLKVRWRCGDAEILPRGERPAGSNLTAATDLASTNRHCQSNIIVTIRSHSPPSNPRSPRPRTWWRKLTPTILRSGFSRHV